mgnify:CR=1 FL=1
METNIADIAIDQEIEEQTKKCWLCDEWKDTREFQDKRFYHIYEICNICREKARKRIEILTDFDLKVCEEIGLDYRKITSLRTLRSSEQELSNS